jgi:membrane protease YdiL (CAAX protease family)
MTSEKFLFHFGWVSLLSWIIHFTISFSEYSTCKIITAAVFLIIALTIYYAVVYVYFRLKSGEIIVSAGLIVIVLNLVFFIFTDK